SMFNASIRNVGKFLYSQQIYEQINNSSTIVLSAQSFVVILINFALVLVQYVYMYRKKQLLAS
ncbi:MAG: ABC transporter permease, partial [[Clostridium] innocuum]